MDITLGGKATIYSNDPDQYIDLKVVENGLEIKITNDFATYFIGDRIEVKSESFQCVLTDGKLRDIRNFISVFREQPGEKGSVNLKLPYKMVKKSKGNTISKHKGILEKEEKIPVTLVIETTNVEDLVGIDLYIPNTEIYCDIEIGEDLDTFETYVRKAIEASSVNISRKNR